jgi:hypothetical protein
MYLLLLVFGAVLTAAGIVLAASGVSIHDRVFDVTVVAPGTVAAVGGLVLVGLGLALRVLQRIERSLSAGPMPRVLRPGQAIEATAATASRTGAAQIPFPPKTAPKVAVLSHGPAVAASTATPLAVADDKRLEDSTEKLPKKASVALLEGAAAAEVTEVSLTPSAVPRAEIEVGDANLRAARRINGTATARLTPRLDIDARSSGTRPSIAPERSKGPAFDSLWPKGPAPGPVRGAQAASLKPLPEPPATAALIEPKRKSEPVFRAAAVVQDAAPEPVTVLKSGVVDGMAYTLFSDGSIEAGLPQGTLRFGSIADLRNHMEQNA